MFTTVVVGWDGTPESEAAVAWAAERRGDAPLTLIHAIGARSRSSEYLRATGEGSPEGIRLTNVAERLRATHPDLHGTTETKHGSAIDVLGDLLGPDTLVVVGGPSHHQTSRWTVGSRLAGRRGGGTVAVIPETPATERRVAFVAGVDGSHASLAAVEIAAAEADRLAEPLELVHAWQVPASWNAMLAEFASDVAVLKQIHRDLLDDAVAFGRGLGADPTGRLEDGRAHRCAPTDRTHAFCGLNCSSMRRSPSSITAPATTASWGRTARGYTRRPARSRW